MAGTHVQFCRVIRRLVGEAPAFHVVAGTGMDLEVVPVVAVEELDHHVGQGRRARLARIEVTPRADWYAVGRIAADGSLQALAAVHQAPQTVFR